MRVRFWNNLFPSVIWIGYHAAIPQWHWSFLSLLMLLRGLIVLGLFLYREKPSHRAPKYQIVIAWISTFLPVLMVWEPGDAAGVLVGQILSISGIILFVFTALDLGRSFGVSPAIRSRVSSGIYRRINHPMYWSHVIVEAGIVIASPTVLNVWVAGFAWVLYLIRARWESQLISSIGS